MTHGDVLVEGKYSPLTTSPKLIDIVVALLCRNRVNEALEYLIDFAVFFSDREDFIDMTLEGMECEIVERRSKAECLQLSDKDNFWWGEEGGKRRL